MSKDAFVSRPRFRLAGSLACLVAGGGCSLLSGEMATRRAPEVFANAVDGPDEPRGGGGLRIFGVVLRPYMSKEFDVGLVAIPDTVHVVWVYDDLEGDQYNLTTHATDLPVRGQILDDPNVRGTLWIVVTDDGVKLVPLTVSEELDRERTIRAVNERWRGDFQSQPQLGPDGVWRSRRGQPMMLNPDGTFTKN
jgi:hypothetical protein